jgi:hypothetical protein
MGARGERKRDGGEEGKGEGRGRERERGRGSSHIDEIIAGAISPNNCP